MTLEEAIRTAIEFEKKIWKAYQAAEDKIDSPVGKRVFGLLAQEERDHVAYLESQLEVWKATKKVSADRLETAVPSKGKIEAKMGEVKTSLAEGDHGGEVGFLQKALAPEGDATAFSATMTATLPEEGRDLFGRFLEIEEGHTAIVQAEIDSVTRTGNWFDLQEFDMV